MPATGDSLERSLLLRSRCWRPHLSFCPCWDGKCWPTGTRRLTARLAREFLGRSWLIPTWQFQPWLEKPPLGMWITAAFFHFFGATQFWARAASAFSGIALVALLHWTTARARGLQAAWTSTGILNGLVEEIGETANIGTLDGGDIVYLDRVEAKHWPLRLNFHIGSRVPLHCTAIGKLFLAYMPEHQRNALLGMLDLHHFTPHTIASVSALQTELAAIREEGLSIDREEYILGVVCIAAPVFNPKGEMLAGVAIQSPTARMSPKDALRYSVPLQRAARALAESFVWESTNLT